MSLTLPLTLKELHSLVSSELDDLTAGIDDGFVPVAGATDGADLLNIFINNKLNSWVISAGEENVGVLALGYLNFPFPDDGKGKWVQTSTYILSPHRGKGYNILLKRATSKAFLNYPGYRLCSVVKDWNETSQASLKKIFPTVTPLKQRRTAEQLEQDPAEYQFFYDLSNIERAPVFFIERPIYATVDSWLRDSLPHLNVRTPVLV